MDTSLNPCLCKDLYGYLMILCLGLGFFFPICWLGILLPPTMKLLGLVQFWGLL